MNKATLAALKKSIKKWEFLVKNPHADEPSCALCDRFQITKKDRCQRVGGEICPVSKATGRSFCEGSPYYDFHRTKAGARAELTFLKSLLPKRKRK